ncbi:MAG TPA: hypothetical protein VGB59_02515 [Allosphingosinicella sp.]|jgi:hypothetical protein
MRSSILTVAAAFAASIASPALAAEDPRCSAMPQQVRAALGEAEKGVAARAERRLRTGEALCRAHNARAAAKEFQLALKLLGRDSSGTALAGK